MRFDDTGISNSYSNVCNVSSSREEVVLVFGMNNAWERDAGEVRVKRLAMLMDSIVKQYEGRFGAMDIGIAQTDKATK